MPTWLLPILGKGLAGAALAAGAFFLFQDYMGTKTDNATLRANNANLKEQIEGQGQTINALQELHARAQETANANLEAERAATNNYIQAMQENHDLTLKLEKELQNAPYRAAADATESIDRMLTRIWRRGQSRGQENSGDPETPAGAVAGNGAEAERAEATGN